MEKKKIGKKLVLDMFGDDQEMISLVSGQQRFSNFEDEESDQF